jgi:hypothetical protein
MRPRFPACQVGRCAARVHTPPDHRKRCTYGIRIAVSISKHGERCGGCRRLARLKRYAFTIHIGASGTPSAHPRRAPRGAARA